MSYSSYRIGTQFYISGYKAMVQKLEGDRVYYMYMDGPFRGKVDKNRWQWLDQNASQTKPVEVGK